MAAPCVPSTPLQPSLATPSTEPSDEAGRTPVMLAVLGGRFDEAVKLALSGADLNKQDATGRTALALAIEMHRREVALALLLISTSKFTRPLPGLLAPALLQQLQMWLSTSGPEKEAAMQVLLQQYSDNLTAACAASDNGAQQLYAASNARPAAVTVAPQVAAGLVEMLVWASRHALTRLIDALVSSFSAHSSDALPPSTLALARSAEGLSVLHALVLAGQPAAVSALLAALPSSEAGALRAHRDSRGREAATLDAAAAPPALQSAVSAALATLHALPPVSSLMLPPPPRIPTRSPAPAPAPMSESKPSCCTHPPGVASCASADATPLSRDTAMNDASSEAATLLEFASQSSGGGGQHSGAFVIGAGPAPVPVKVKRGGGRRASRGALVTHTHAAKDDRVGAAWVPNACEGHKLSAVLPPGRQPGELAGWTPLAGEAKQRAFCEQRQALNQTEALVQGLGSRDAAVQYLSQLRHHDTAFAPESQHIVSTVDDSAIEMSGEKSTHYKRLATWGGFRRHHTKAARALASRETDSSLEDASRDSFESTAEISEAKIREQQASDNYDRVAGGGVVPVAPVLVVAGEAENAPLPAEVAAVHEQLRQNEAEAQLLLARLRTLEAQRHQLEQMLR